MKFMETHDDWTLYDTFKPIKRRGTWKHWCGKWYELDLFLGPKEQQKRVLSISTVAFGQSDHMAKVMAMTLHTDEKIVKKRLRRKTKCEELQRQHDKKDRATKYEDDEAAHRQTGRPNGGSGETS